MMQAVAFERGRKVLLRQTLPHAFVGHPAASLCVLVGRQDWADAVHYATLPARAKRTLHYERPVFNPDPRLRPCDMILVPVCSVARAFGWYRLAHFIFHLGPWQVAEELGACSYAYEPKREPKQLDPLQVEANKAARFAQEAAVKKRQDSCSHQWVDAGQRRIGTMMRNMLRCRRCGAERVAPGWA